MIEPGIALSLPIATSPTDATYATQDDLTALVDRPADQPGLRKLGTGALDAMPGNMVMTQKFVDLLDVLNGGADERGDIYLRDGEGNLISVPWAIFKSAFGASYTGSLLETFINGSGGGSGPQITTTSLPVGTVGVAYAGANAILQATGGALPLTWSLVAGALPAPETLIPSTGAITGTPSATASLTPTFMCVDALGRSASATLTMTVVAAGSSLAFATPTMPDGRVGDVYTFNWAGYVSGGTAPYFFDGGSPPTQPNKGLQLPTSAGVSTGTLNAVTTTPMPVRVRVTDSASATVTINATLDILPRITPNLLVDAHDRSPLNSAGREPLVGIDTGPSSDYDLTAAYAAVLAAPGAHVYYVNPTGLSLTGPTSAVGSDGAAGTLANPFATLAHAAAAPSATACIVLGNGICRESVVQNGALTIMSYPGTFGWCKGTDIVTGWTANGAIWKKTGWDMTKLRRTHAAIGSGGDTAPYAFYDELLLNGANQMAGYPDQFFCDDVPLMQVATLAECTPGSMTFYLDVSASATTTLYISENPSSCVVEGTTRPTFITGATGGGPSGNSTGSQYLGLGVVGYGTTFNPSAQQAALMCVASNSSSWLIKSCVFAYNANMAITFNTGDDHVVDNSVFIYQGCLHGHSNLANNLTVKNSRFMYGNDQRFDTTPSSFQSIAAWKNANLTGSRWSRNIFDDNHSNSLWFDVDCSDTIVSSSVFQRNFGYGPNNEVSSKVLVINSIVTDNSFSGVKFADSSTATAGTGALLWNCTTALNGAGGSGIRSEVFYYDDPRVSGNRMDKGEQFNNVFVLGTSGADSIIKSLDNSVFTLNKTTTAALTTAGAFTTSLGHTFTATCASGSTVLTVVNFGTLTIADAGATVTGPAGVLQSSTTLTYPAKVNSLANMLSGGSDKNLYVRLHGFTSKALAKVALPYGVTATPATTTLARLQSQTGMDANSVLYDAVGSSLDEIFMNAAALDYELMTPIAAIAPTPNPLSAQVIARLGIGSYTPLTVGANDDLAVLIDDAALPVLA